MFICTLILSCFFKKYKYGGAKRKHKKHKDKQSLVFATWKHDVNYKASRGEKLNSFVGLPHSLLMNKNFLQLNPTSKLVYIYMLDYSNGEIETTFPQSIYSKITCKSSFENAKKELTKYGFIEEVANGRFTRTENIYKFSDKWKTLDIPPKRKNYKNNFHIKKD